MKTVNFLDVTLDLESGHHWPYNKPGNTTIYVKAQSNHPKNIIKNIPMGVNIRLSSISSNKDVFDSNKELYQAALDKNGYNHELTYEKSNKSNKKRRRNIIWFNPPFNKEVKSNIGRQFLNALRSAFPKDHKLNKLFNKNTVKLSYSCMDNMQDHVNKHNKKLISMQENDKDNSSSTCNCRRKPDCPLNGKCKEKSIVYQAVVSTSNNEESYIGLTANNFKERFNNHKATFTKKSLKNSTELSKHIWRLKEAGEQYTIKWRIVKKAKAYSNISKKCQLCLWEKFYIIYHPSMASLNKRSELVSTCRHASKFLVKNI